MQSVPRKAGFSRLAVLGLAVAVALGGRGRQPAPSPRVAASAASAPAEPVSAPARLSWGTVSAVLLAVAIVAAAIAEGYRLKFAREQRASAIALTQGNPEHGRELTMRFGCRGCHTIPGVSGPKGNVGPDLGDVARQVYVGGVVTNTPDNLIRWIVDPKSIDAKTAMPVTGISATEARDVAAYLYSLP